MAGLFEKDNHVRKLVGEVDKKAVLTPEERERYYAVERKVAVDSLLPENLEGIEDLDIDMSLKELESARATLRDLAKSLFGKGEG